jgi:uncharacterized protein
MQHAVHASERVRVRRQPSRGRYRRAAIYAVLDAGLVAHVAFVDGDQPFCIPMLQARIGDALLIHGSSASRAVRVLARGVPACVTVTLLDGLVLARSAFEHSANYRAAVLLGSFRPVDDPAQRLAAFEAFTNKIIPGRWDEVRSPSRTELKATAILALPIVEASVKSRTGPPTDDDSADAARETWAGVIPIENRFGAPKASPGLRPGIALQPSVSRLLDEYPGSGGPQSISA